MTIGDDFSRVLSAARSGDRGALERIYRDVAPIARGFLFANGAVDVDDVVGETFISVITGLGSFAGDEREFRSWVLKIAFRRHVDVLRRTGRRQEEPFDPDTLVSWAGHAQTAEQAALGGLAVADLLAAMRDLTDDQRQVVTLRALADLTIPQIAAVVGKPETAVKALLHRAGKRLRVATERDARGA